MLSIDTGQIKNNKIIPNNTTVELDRDAPKYDSTLSYESAVQNHIMQEQSKIPFKTQNELLLRTIRDFRMLPNETCGCIDANGRK